MRQGHVFKRVVPKGLDHTLSVITISLYVCVCVCVCVCVYVCVCAQKWSQSGGLGGWDHFGLEWSGMVSDHS